MSVVERPRSRGALFPSLQMVLHELQLLPEKTLVQQANSIWISTLFLFESRKMMKLCSSDLELFHTLRTMSH